MKKLRIGIAGSVGHADKFVNLINSYEESEVVVYCAQDAESKEIAQRLGLAYETDYQTMLENYDLDGMVITVPNAQKRDMVIAAAQAGVSVFLEKPLSASTADALAMQEAVHKAGIKFYMSDPFVRPGILMLKRLIAAGNLGDVVSANVRLAMDRAFKEAPLAHIYDKALSGGGIMADQGTHALHIIHYLFGQPQSLCASIRAYTDAAKTGAIEEQTTAILRYADGMTVTLETSWISGGGNANHAIVYGTDAWSEVIDLPGKEGNQQLTLHKADGAVVYTPEDLPPMPKRHVRYFVEMMLHNLPNDIIGTVEESNCGVGIDNAVQLTRIIEAIYEAADGKFVEL